MRNECYCAQISHKFQIHKLSGGVLEDIKSQIDKLIRGVLKEIRQCAMYVEDQIDMNHKITTEVKTICVPKTTHSKIYIIGTLRFNIKV